MEGNDKGWFATLMEQLTKAFEKFIKIFKKYGVLTSIIFMALFICFWSLIIYPVRLDNIIEDRLQHQWEKEKEHIETEKSNSEEMRIKANEIISPLMEDIVDKFKVDRCLLFELHNNSKNISAIDFLFFSCTYEAININDYKLDYIGDNLQRQYVNNMFGAEIITMLKHKDYLEYSNLCEYKRNKRLLTKLHKFGAENVMLVPIRNDKQQPVIIICICNKDAIVYNKVYEYIKPFINQIQQTLIGA